MTKRITVFFIALCTAGLPLLSCGTRTQFNVPAKISFISGSVFVNGRAAALNQGIHYGDILETKERSFCRIVIDTNNVVGMQNNTTFVYNVKHGDGLLELKRGYLGAIIKNRDNVKIFRIKTRTVTAAVRGTSLFVGIESPESTYTCVCNGRIHFHPGGGTSSQAVAAPHHKATFYNLKDNRIIEEPGTLLYHDDASMEKLAASIGLSIDWTKIPE
ncbi:MAG TPA: FecR domain-containing protein [Spirochaetota bacterium]|nr:FecR domain-containing protein [Spirochaetota bacterium]HPJ39478.1 FecR domain-containing protein [Spirochaetota bacterium]HPQ53526.1 FecR domain-containing protein [Spirochaetota bacterium]